MKQLIERAERIGARKAAEALERAAAAARDLLAADVMVEQAPGELHLVGRGLGVRAQIDPRLRNFGQMIRERMG